MAVDRGGTQYAINLRDGFSATFTKFAAEAAKAREEWAKFKAEVAAPPASSGGVTANTAQVVRELRQARTSLSSATRTLNRHEDTRARRLAVSRVEVQKSNLAAQELLKTRQALLAVDAQDIRLLVSRERSLRRANRALREQRKELEKIAALRKGTTTSGGVTGRSGGGRTTGGTTIIPDRAVKNSKQARENVEKTESSANRIAFTFRRLFGIFAAFTAARLLVQGFTDLVRLSIEFNSRLESARLGVAALFTAVGGVRDATGSTVTNAQRLGIAQSEARRQTLLLRRDALRTAATFDTLVETFQIGLAPGLEAGLTPDQIRRFAVQVSQAASAVGLPQNQLAEEIRSILAGTIQARTTRIAVALGITNEDIRQAKELGNLAEFLEGRFSAFNEAGTEALKTFAALVTNTKDALLQVLEAGSLGFFEEIKDTLAEIQEAVLLKDGEGILKPRPELVRFIQAFAQSLARGVRAARRIGTAIEPELLIRLAELFGDIFSTVVSISAAVKTGFIRGLADVAYLLEPITDAFDQIFATNEFAGVVALVTEILTIWVATSVVVKAISGGLGLIYLAVKAWQTGMAALLAIGTALHTVLKGIRATYVAIAALSSAAATPWVLLAAAVVLVAALAARFHKEIQQAVGATEQLEIRFGTFLKIAQEGFKQMRDFFRISLTRAWLSFQRLVLNGYNKLAQAMLDAALFVLRAVNKAAGGLDGVISKIEGLRNDPIFSAATEEVKRLDREIARLKKTAAQAVDPRQFARIIANGAKDKTFGETVSDLANEVGEALSKGIAGFFDFTQKGAESTASFAAALESLGAIIEANRKGIEETGSAFDRVVDGIEKAKSALEEARIVSGVSGVASGIAREQARSVTAARRLTKKLDEDEAKLKARQNALTRQRASLEAQVLRLTEDQQNAVRLNTERLGVAARLQRERQFSIQRTLGLTEDLKTAEKEGDLDRANALRTQIEREKERAEQLKDSLDTLTKVAEVELAALDVSEEVRQKILDLSVALLKTQGQSASLAERGKDIADDRLRVEALISRETTERVRALAEETRIANRLVEARARAEGRRDDALAKTISFREGGLGSGFVDTDKQRVAQAEIRLQFARDELAVLREQQGINQAVLETERKRREAAIQIAQRELSTAQAGGDPKAILAAQEALTSAKAAQVEVEAQISSEQRIQTLELEKQNREVDQLERQLELAKQIDADPIGQGLLAGAETFVGQASSVYENFRQVTLAGLESLSSTISGTIADAFDPDAELDIRERFRRLFADLSRMLTEFLVKLALAKLVGAAFGNPALGGVGGGGGGIGSLLGLQRGGLVPAGRFAASAAHYGPRARAYAHGGHVGASGSRPSGIPASDTIPAWLTPGEFVVTREVAAKFMPVLQALHNGLVEPKALMAAVKRTGPRMSVSRSGGYARGGSVTTAGRAPSAGGGPVRAFVLADNEVLEQIFTGGRSALERALDDLGVQRGTRAGIG